jgi:hypothetical protein
MANFTMNTVQTFVGWVPTVLGRLSWTKIGAEDQRGRVDRLPRGENQTFVVRQTRKLGDGLFPSRQEFARRSKAFFFGLFASSEARSVAYQISKKFNFYLVANRVDDGAQLRGWIACVTAKNDPFRKDFDHATASPRDCPQYAEKLHETLLDFVSDHNNRVMAQDNIRYRSKSIRLVKFELKRNGITRITPIPSPSPDAKLRVEEYKLVAQQCFYFLKDMGHIHQHHSVSSECQFLLHPENGVNRSWESEILKDLQRAVITARRERDDVNALHNSVGISQYAQTFASLCMAMESNNQNRRIKLPVKGNSRINTRASPQVAGNSSTMLESKVPQLQWAQLQSSVHSVSAQASYNSKVSERNFSAVLGSLALVIAICGSYHILYAIEKLGKLSLTNKVLPPISFLSHRLFEWDVGDVTNRLWTLALWAIIIFCFAIGMSLTLRRFASTIFRYLVDLFVRLQITSPKARMQSRIIAGVAVIVLFVLAAYIAKLAVLALIEAGVL